MVLRYLLKALMLPPALNIILIGLGFYFYKKNKRRTSSLLISFGFIGLWILSTPAISTPFLHSIESYHALSVSQTSQEKGWVIVVLGGGLHKRAPEYGGYTIQQESLVRLRYAAKLKRTTQLPLLVSGGNGDSLGLSEAELMTSVLKKDFATSPTWIENQSRTTWENAQFSAKILKASGYSKVYLVTHARHMKRAVFSFEQAGLTVKAAPTGFGRPLSDQSQIYNLTPSIKALRDSNNVIHELMGLLWYYFKAKI